MNWLQDILCYFGFHNYEPYFYERVETEWPHRVLIKKCTHCRKCSVEELRKE